MNILVICTSEGRGGLELHAKREVNFLTTQNQCSCYFVVRENGYLANYAQESGVQSFHLQWKFRALPVVSAIKLARYIDSNCIDIMHIHWGKDLSLAALAKVFSRRKPKLLYTRHMGITRSKKDLYHAFLYGQVDRVLTVSKQVHKEAAKFLPLEPDQIKLFYLGVPPAKAKRETKIQVQLPGNVKRRSFNVGMFGRIEHGKGQHLLVDAIELLVNHKVDVSATFIGHIMDECYFKTIKQTIEKKGLTDRIDFVDFIDTPMEVMPCFDVITLLTYCETFGLVLVEAMRAGVAVIGTDAGGVPEIIQNNNTGLLIPPGDSVALAEKLSCLYEDKEKRERLAQNGKKRADSIFDEETNFNVLVSMFYETYSG